MPGLLSDAQKARMTTLVAKTMDVQVTIIRNTVTGTDSYGHTVSAPTTIGTPLVNIIRPTDTMLQQFAGIIGSQRALLIRYMPTSDIRQGDTLVYSGINWKVSEILISESYTVTNDALITAVI